VKPFAVGLFADLSGDDLYRGGGLGFVRVPEEGPDGPWPKAFFLDLGGRDRYEVEGSEAADGAAWTKNRYGFGADR
jgi:hypothetical protein